MSSRDQFHLEFRIGIVGFGVVEYTYY